MKKSIIALFAAATMVAGVNAQDVEGGSGATGAGLTTGQILGSVVVVGAIGVGVAGNSNADAPTVVDPDPAVPTCEGTDPLVDGVCVGTTNTVTVTTSGTTTATTTVTVPVTFTYSPTVQ
ncbi:MAG: hypothetical protein ABNH03_11500 [Alteromonas sp.]|jgi:hypothetical protein|uniref:hypothetical protein n=1 Tax=Alteromonas TaxID=226 RepID=UPI000B69D92F|nr:hypothetical protein [Alteromonas sp.]MAI36943.1 hypothetical protein [Alteromonas sp.]OUX89995.1 MAG: hypothetical protein CBB95_05195 [Alteromonas sp. TMED35]|tara:strand:+ start:3918 stop:4277 length:360 start_codon:yes stop_codon:yes gene_type:complete